MYPSTKMLIAVQKYKLQYGKISPILSTQTTAPVQKKISWSISQYKNINSRTNIFIGCANIFFSTIKYMYMLWFNFIFGLNFIFYSFKLIIIHYHIRKQYKIKLEPRIKLNHNIYNSRTTCMPVQKYKFQYKKKTFGTEKYIFKKFGRNR